MVNWQARFFRPGTAVPMPLVPNNLNSGAYRVVNVPQNHFFFAAPDAGHRFIMTEGCGPCVGLALWERGSGGLVAHFDAGVLVGNAYNNVMDRIDRCVPLPSEVRIVTGGGIANNNPTTQTIRLLENSFFIPIDGASADAVVLDVQTGAAYLTGGNFRMRAFPLQDNFARNSMLGLPRRSHFGRIA